MVISPLHDRSIIMAEKCALDSKSTPSSNKRVRFNEEEGQEVDYIFSMRGVHRYNLTLTLLIMSAKR